MEELNSGGYPVKNAGYWRRRSIKLELEVAELKEELNTAKFVNCERCVEKTAMRCAEIAEGMAGDLPIDIGHAIRREFGLPKAG